MNEERLSQLFRRFQTRGDIQALAEVFDLAAPQLEKVARHLCRDEAEAEDALQATFQTAIEKAADWQATRPLLPWLLGILTHHAQRARERAGRAIEADRLPQPALADPAALAADRELGKLVAEKLDTLPVAYAPAVRSYLMDGKPAREIARMLGISANAASVRVHRGLKLLQRALPAGIALGGAGVLVAPRGMAAVKQAVLASAGEAARLGAPSATAASTAGGLLTSKAMLAVAGAAVVGGALYLSPLDLSFDSRPAAPESRQLASAGRLESGTQPPQSTPTAGNLDAGPASVRLDVAADEASSVPAAQPLDSEAWLRRFAEAEGWRAGLKIAYEIAALPPDDALALLQAIYHRIPDVAHRQQALKPFVFQGGHIHAVEILHLAATDDSLEVQGWAFTYLKDYAFQDFSEDYPSYEAWRSRHAGLPLGELLTSSAESFVVRLRLAQGKQLARELQLMEDLDLRAGAVGGVDLAAVLRDEGLLALLDDWLVSTDPGVQRTALAWMPQLQPGESWLRGAVLPLVNAGPAEDSATFSAACLALGRSADREASWAVDALLDAVRQAPSEMRATLYAPLQALGESADARVIPDLIGMLVSDPSMQYAVGYYALAQLTGVTYDQSQDGAFWLDWWERNQGRLPAAIRGASIPSAPFTR